MATDCTPVIYVAILTICTISMALRSLFVANKSFQLPLRFISSLTDSLISVHSPVTSFPPLSQVSALTAFSSLLFIYK
uniref:Uncharacterized protein n=1 Tax=Panstrongylus lignarius TaxID=156445 RepID=A0A224Y581_9HEMI